MRMDCAIFLPLSRTRVILVIQAVEEAADGLTFPSAEWMLLRFAVVEVSLLTEPEAGSQTIMSRPWKDLPLFNENLRSRAGVANGVDLKMLTGDRWGSVGVDMLRCVAKCGLHHRCEGIRR